MVIRGCDGTAPIVIAAHAHCATYAHGQLRILAHEQEVGSTGVLEMAKLVVVESGNHLTHRVNVMLSVFGSRFAIDEYHLVGFKGAVDMGINHTLDSANAHIAIMAAKRKRIRLSIIVMFLHS